MSSWRSCHRPRTMWQKLRYLDVLRSTMINQWDLHSSTTLRYILYKWCRHDVDINFRFDGFDMFWFVVATFFDARAASFLDVFGAQWSPVKHRGPPQGAALPVKGRAFAAAFREDFRRLQKTWYLRNLENVIGISQTSHWQDWFWLTLYFDVFLDGESEGYDV